MRKPELGEFPVEAFKENPKNARTVYCVNELKILGESLLVQQFEPLTADFDYQLFGGHRRLRAAKLVGKKTLLAVLSEQSLSASESSLVTTFHNVHLTAFEKFGAVEMWFQENQNGKAKDLAARIGYDASMISKIYSLKSCIPAVFEAAKDGRLGISVWSQISPHTADIQRQMLAAALNGASRADLKKKGRTAKNGLRELKLDKLTIPYAGGEVIVTGKGLGMVELVDVFDRILKDARRNIGKIEVKTWIATRRDQLKAGQP